MKLILACAASLFLLSGCGGGGDGGGTTGNTGNTGGQTVTVASLPDWSGFQGNARHTGYVPVTLDANRFAKIWEWKRPVSSEPIGGINAVSTGLGLVFVSTDVYFGEASLHALRETDGTQAWQQAFGTQPALSPPTYSDGKIFIATTGHSDTFLWSFNADTGSFRNKAAFEGQWPHVLAPTVQGQTALVGAGYDGGVTFAFSTVDGNKKWTHSAGGAWDMYAPAADATRAYHHNGNSLFIMDLALGTTIATITDPFGTGSDYSYHGGPMLGGRDNVITFSGGAFSGRASSNVEQYGQRVLSSFNLKSFTYEWSTQSAYLTAPAVAKGVFYAGRNSPMALDAIDEASGKTLWSWTPPAGNLDASFHRNIVVTDNLLFVSTDRSVYAIDLQTHAAVWRYAEPGMLAISANHTLFIAPGATESDGRLVAIRLK